MKKPLTYRRPKQYQDQVKISIWLSSCFCMQFEDWTFLDLFAGLKQKTIKSFLSYARAWQDLSEVVAAGLDVEYTPFFFIMLCWRLWIEVLQWLGRYFTFFILTFQYIYFHGEERWIKRVLLVWKALMQRQRTWGDCEPPCVVLLVHMNSFAWISYLLSAVADLNGAVGTSLNSLALLLPC